MYWGDVPQYQYQSTISIKRYYLIRDFLSIISYLIKPLLLKKDFKIL